MNAVTPHTAMERVTIDVVLVVTKAQPSGKIFGRVFADAAAFKAADRYVTQFAIDPAGSNSAQTTLALPPGRYAIALFQDTKGTGKLEANLLGIPTVPYGFSNDAKGKIGKPKFNAAAFDVGPTAKTLTITLR